MLVAQPLPAIEDAYARRRSRKVSLVINKRTLIKFD